MATVERKIIYRCSDDCRWGGCPSHVGKLTFQSTSDAYMFDMDGKVMHFERGELDAMLRLLKSLGRVDSVKWPKD